MYGEHPVLKLLKSRLQCKEKANETVNVYVFLFLFQEIHKQKCNRNVYKPIYS